MGLSFYSIPNPDNQLNESPYTPLTFTFDGKYGGKQQKPFYLRNDNQSTWYDNIVVSIAGTGPTGCQYKLVQSDVPPSEEYWGKVASGTSVVLPGIIGSSAFADIVTYITFWARVELPAWLPAQTNKNIYLQVNATEHLVNG